MPLHLRHVSLVDKGDPRRRRWRGVSKQSIESSIKVLLLVGPMPHSEDDPTWWEWHTQFALAVERPEMQWGVEGAPEYLEWHYRIQKLKAPPK